MKKNLSKLLIIFITFILTSCVIYKSYADDINSRTCVVFDRNSHMILYGKNEQKQVKMASTTKIMTALIVIESCNLEDTITVSKKAASTGGSRLGLKANDKVTIKDLLYGLMLVSGNDSAVALAEHVGGDIQGFANLMNNKAKGLGLINTHYESPHGLDSNNHYTTAYELAKLTDYALENEIFLKIVGTKNYTININGHSKNLLNTNELLGNLDGVYGVKTGFTNGANRCLVTSCKRGDMDIICVVLGADTKNYRTKDSIKLIEYTFNDFTYINANDIATTYFDKWKVSNLNSLNILKSSCKSIELSIKPLKNPLIPINKNVDDISCNISIKPNLEAPIDANTILGTLSIYLDSTDNTLATFDIVNNNSINRKNILYYIKYFFYNYNSILENLL